MRTFTKVEIAGVVALVVVIVIGMFIFNEKRIDTARTEMVKETYTQLQRSALLVHALAKAEGKLSQDNSIEIDNKNYLLKYGYPAAKISGNETKGIDYLVGINPKQWEIKSNQNTISLTPKWLSRRNEDRCTIIYQESLKGKPASVTFTYPLACG